MYVFIWLIFLVCVFYFFFCKQKTAYEMRISDWSSDVCSSDLANGIIARMTQGLTMERPAHVPEELVRDYPIRMGTITPENPFDRMIPEIHAEIDRRRVV